MKYLLLVVMVLFYSDQSFAQPQHLIIPLDHFSVKVLAELKPAGGTQVDRMPVPPQNVLNLLVKNISLPTEEAISECIEGKILTRFLIDTDGHVKDISVKYGVHKILDARVVNALTKIPAWTPAYKDGKPVGVYFTLPFVFEIKSKGCKTSDNLYNEALALYKRGKTDRALDNFKFIVRQNYSDVEVLFNIAAIYLQQNKPEEACPYLKQILDVTGGVNPKDRDVVGLVKKYCESN